MKKLIILILAIISMFFIYSTVKAEEVLIPDSSIRLRVVANSNSIYDQSMKKQVKDYIEDEVYELLKNVDRIEDARKIISDNLDNINSDIESIFVDYNYDMDYKVDFGYNYFPNKVFKTVNYKEGYYESLVVYIGEAKGDNWWCVLFPPLCLIDTDNVSDNEYSFFVGEVIKDFFKNNK